MANRKVIKNLKGLPEDRIVVSPNGIQIIGKEDIERKHTEEIQDIITKVPSWIVRWGIGLVFSSILIILAITILVPYPNTVKSTLQLRSIGTTVPVVVDNSGIITKVFVKTGMVVKQGQPLIEIDNEYSKDFLIKSPASGRIGFSAVVQKNILIGAKQEVFRIHPINEQFYGIMQIPKNKISSVKSGQEVLIKPAGSNLATTEIIKGKVDFVADEPVNDRFLIKVVFDKPFSSNRGDIKIWMDFEGQIITKRSNLFLKFFGGVVDVYNSF